MTFKEMFGLVIQRLMTDDFIRALTFLIVISAFVYMQLTHYQINESMSSVTNVLIGYYFGRTVANEMSQRKNGDK